MARRVHHWKHGWIPLTPSALAEARKRGIDVSPAQAKKAADKKAADRPESTRPDPPKSWKDHTPWGKKARQEALDAKWLADERDRIWLEKERRRLAAKKR